MKIGNIRKIIFLCDKKPMWGSQIIFSILAFACQNNNYINDELARVSYNPNPYFLNLIQESLSDENWPIGLNTNILGQYRDLSNYASVPANPKNWITITDNECNALGVPQNIKDNCEFQKDPSIAGLCYYRSYGLNNVDRKGEIIDTTILIRKDIFLNTSFKNSYKKSIVIHELGHCLGLQHWGNGGLSDEVSGQEPIPNPGEASLNTHIMYPFVTSIATMPSFSEKLAVANVYSSGDDGSCNSTQPNLPCVNPLNLGNVRDCNKDPVVASSIPYSIYETNLPCYFNMIKDDVGQNIPFLTYQKNFPKFSISNSLGNSVMLAEEVAPFKSSKEPSESLKQTDIVENFYYVTIEGTEKIIQNHIPAELK